MTREPLRLYLESSFWRRLVDPASSPRRGESFGFLNGFAAGHSILISPLVIAELRMTTDPSERRLVLKYVVRRSTACVGRIEESRRLAGELVRNSGRGSSVLDDMTHLGFAILARARAFVTWDVADLARPKTRAVVQDVCARLGLPQPLIGTPSEIRSWLSTG